MSFHFYFLPQRKDFIQFLYQTIVTQAIIIKTLNPNQIAKIQKMNWDNLFKLLYKCFLISYMILWSMQINKDESKYLNNLKNTLYTVQVSYLGMQPTFLTLTQQIMQYYSHFLFVVGVSVMFSWSISRLLSITVLLINFLLLSTRRQFMFLGIDIILIAIVMQIDLRDKNNKKQVN